MAKMSDYLEGAFLKYLFRNTAVFAKPASVYFALFTAAPSDSGGGTEVAAGDYARLELTTGADGTGVGSVFDAPAGEGGGGQVCDNAAEIIFPAAVASWGTIEAFALFDADIPGGNMFVWGTLSSPVLIDVGDQIKFAAGNLDIIFR